MISSRVAGLAGASSLGLMVNGPSPQNWVVKSPTRASFSITRVDGIEDMFLVAPFGAWFTASSIDGFVGFNGGPMVEPPGDDNVYDPTQHEIFWSWDFGDPNYKSLKAPNIPTKLNDRNTASCKRPAHVYDHGGSYTVRCFAFDSAGNWATATYLFGAGGQAPAIADPDTYFQGNKTCYFSPEGVFPDPLPQGAGTATTVDVVNRYRQSRATAGDHLVRIRLRRGETYTNLAEMDVRNVRGYFDAYGDASDPLPKHIRSDGQSGPFGARDGDYLVVVNQDFTTFYDAATETGRRGGFFTPLGAYVDRMLIHRVRVSGLGSFYLGANSGQRILSDLEITNWQDYGIYGGDVTPLSLALIGCDIHQNPRALSGTDHGTANSNFANLTNRHGPIRHGQVRNHYVACSSFFSRNGWSLSYGGGSGSTVPPTAPQAAYRFGDSGATPHRTHVAFEKNSFEGGDGQLVFVDLSNSATADYVSNVVVDRSLFVASGQTTIILSGKSRGATIRNNFFLVPALSRVTSGETRMSRAITWDFSGPDLSDVGRNGAYVYNNTFYFLPKADQMGGGERIIAMVDTRHLSQVIENNLVAAPNTTAPQPGPVPLTTSPIVGFTPRMLGYRWNFPPIGHWSMGAAITAESVRELSPGGTTEVATGEWIALPYPNYTGKCQNVLGQVTRSMVDSQSLYHQISVHDYGVKASAPASAGGDGLVTFDFTDAAIRIQNNSGTPWTGPIWVLLDLHSHLMPMDVSGAIPPAEMLYLVPQSESPARPPTKDGLWAREDYFGTLRNEARRPDGSIVVDQPNVRGAIVEVPQ